MIPSVVHLENSYYYLIAPYSILQGPVHEREYNNKRKLMPYTPYTCKYVCPGSSNKQGTHAALLGDGRAKDDPTSTIFRRCASGVRGRHPLGLLSDKATK